MVRPCNGYGIYFLPFDNVGRDMETGGRRGKLIVRKLIECMKILSVEFSTDVALILT
jgi:hypothetical protein